MQYQLRIKFPASSLAQFDELVLIEEKLISILGDNHDVDGHDFGEGEFCIFILTDRPDELTSYLLSFPDLNISKRAKSISSRNFSSDEIRQLWRSAVCLRRD